MDHGGSGGDEPAVSGSYHRNGNGAGAKARRFFYFVIARSEATKQSRAARSALNCFASLAMTDLRHLLLQVREHGVQRFLVHLGLELVAVLERGGFLRRRPGTDLVGQALEILELVPGALAEH